MTLLDVIRFSVSGTTKALSQPVKGRLNFIALYFLVFSVIQILLFFGFFLIYFQVSDETTHSIEVFYNDDLFYRFMFYISFISQLFVLFIALAIWRGGGSEAKVLSFSKSIGSFRAKTYIAYILAILTILLICVVLSKDTNNGFGDMMLNENPFWFQQSGYSWYMHLVKKSLIMIVRFAPAFFVAYYLIWCKKGEWKMRYFIDYLKPVVALLVVWTAMNLLFNYGWLILTDSLMALIAIPFSEMYIPIFFNLLLFLFLSIHFYKIVGYLAYFSVFEWEEPFVAKPNELLEKTEMLDQ